MNLCNDVAGCYAAGQVYNSNRDIHIYVISMHLYYIILQITKLQALDGWSGQCWLVGRHRIYLFEMTRSLMKWVNFGTVPIQETDKIYM